MSPRRHLHKLAQCGVLAAMVMALSLPLTGMAQIRTDGSLGMPAQTLVGANYLIPEALGKRAGGNLFHSFQSFNINSGESANFTTSSPGLLNVISRVTGGSASQINGPLTLTATHGTPAFYFINPAGVTFGEKASVNVPGAFYVSTANYLKFPDGNFYAETRSGSTFSSAEPAAFGFLGTTRATISVKDAVIYNKTGALGLVGGDVEIDHAGVWTDHGDIRLVANGAAPSEVAQRGALPLAEGRLMVSNGSGVFSAAGALAGGKIDMAAGEMGINGGAGVGTLTTTAMPAGAVSAELASLEIDGRGASGSTGISSFAAFSDVGRGGDVSVSTRGTLRVLGGGLISSDTYGQGAAGNLSLKVGSSLLLDGSGHQNGARLTNRAAQGNAGIMTVSAADSIELVNASQISSDSFGAGQAGMISVQAGKDIRVLADSFVASNAYASGNAGAIRIASRNLTVDGTGGQQLTQISSQAFYVSQGNAGLIEINTSGALNLLNGGKIITDTNNIGRAGDIHVTAGSLLLDSRNHVGLTGIYSSNDFSSTGNSGAVTIQVAGDARILQSAQVSSTTWGKGNAGDVVFRANNLEIDGHGVGAAVGISSEVAETSGGQGGSITVDVPGHLKISDRGLISAATLADGNAGSVTINAGQLTIDGITSERAGIQNSKRGNGAGNAGPVFVTVGGDTLITRGGYIRSDTGSSGHGGDLALAFNGNLRLEDGGLITSLTSGSGRAGNIGIQVGGNLGIGRQAGSLGALITTQSFTDGDAGNVTIRVAGDLNLGIGGMITSEAISKGSAGNIDINARRIALAGGDIENLAWIASDSSGAGAAGSINIRAERSIDLADAGFISTDAYGSGHAGKVTVNAPEIHIGGSGLLIGAAISSDTYASGNAGRVEVSGQTLTIEGGNSVFPTGINSRSKARSSGNAGSVNVTSNGQLRVLNGGEIASSTAGSGAGGEVMIKAGSIEVSGAGSRIAAMAMPSSGGQPGSVTVAADGVVRLGAGGSLSIANDGLSARPAAILPSVLKVSGGDLTLEDGSIQANSSGNVAAGALDISFGNRLSLTRSKITTSANAGNGGPITIRGGQIIDLVSSQITTSVSGVTGNGGDISVKSQALVMNSGFIQANTAAPEASGGNVGIDVQLLVPSGNTLFVGGETAHAFQPGVFGFNVIQAAAPSGLSGTVSITSPALDISGTLSGFGTQLLDTGGLGRNPCRIGAGSSFVQSGRGGFAPAARDLLGPAPRRSGPLSLLNDDRHPHLATIKCVRG